MFEKYGGDSMKRSLSNQLTSHLMLGMLIENNCVYPIMIGRMLFGPVYSNIATFVSFLRNLHVALYMLLVTEMAMVRTLQVFKWSFMAGLNDVFMGSFLLQINYGLCIISQVFRYWLGSIYEAHEFPILSGIKVIFHQKLIYIVS